MAWDWCKRKPVVLNKITGEGLSQAYTYNKNTKPFFKVLTLPSNTPELKVKHPRLVAWGAKHVYYDKKNNNNFSRKVYPVGNSFGMFLDFDELESAFNAKKNWDEAGKYLTEKFGHLGLALRSLSGKFKLFVPVIIQDLNQDKAKIIAQDILGELYKCVDKNGFRYCFINEKMYVSLFEYLQSPIFEHQLKSNTERFFKLFNIAQSEPINVKPLIVKFREAKRSKADNWRMFTGTIPSYIKKERKPVQWLFRFMASYFSKSTDSNGVDCPISFLMELSGYGFGTICRARKRLVELGYAIKTSDSIYKIKGDSFVFAGEAETWAKVEYKKLLDIKNNARLPKTLNQIKASFKDGCWNSSAFDLAKWCIRQNLTLEQTVRIAKELPGYNEKQDRPSKFVCAYNNYSRWISSVKQINNELQKLA